MSRKVACFLTIFAVGVLVGVCVGPSVYGKATFVVTASGDPSSVTVHFIDVGQGDSIFVDTSNRDVLIDGGPASAGSDVLDYLDSLNITRIHLMIATHVHADHIGGLVSVLESAINVDAILINNQTYTSSTYTNFMNLAQSHTVTLAQRGQTFPLTETANLSVFNSVQPLEFTSENDNSIVAKLQVGNTYFLFTGDAEADAEQSMLDDDLDLQSDVLKVGHHGSRYSTTQPFLDKITPSYAIVSAGQDNTYGNPHEETIQKLLAKGVTTYGTFISGTIIASTDGASIVFQDGLQPIPEFQPSTLLAIFMIATLLAVILYRKKQCSRKNLDSNS